MGMRSFFEIDLENKEALENALDSSQSTSELASSAVNLAVLATPSGSFSFRFQVAIEIIQNLKYIFFNQSFFLDLKETFFPDTST